MQIDAGTRLQDLGHDFAKTRRLFRRLGIELDAQSQRTVGEACEEAGISLKDFARTITAMAPAGRTMEDWAEAPLQDLVTHIVNRHHAYTRQELPRLERLLEEALAAQGAQLPELAQIRGHFRLLKDDLLQHLEVEERTIFPAILKEGGAPLLATLDDLHRMAMKEHEAAEELFQNIGILTRNFALPLGASSVVRSLYLGLRDLEEDLFMHIYLENHLLFPRTLQTS
jgi:regulator of cell morphogenesis and NO signaling